MSIRIVHIKNGAVVSQSFTPCDDPDEQPADNDHRFSIHPSEVHGNKGEDIDTYSNPPDILTRY